MKTSGVALDVRIQRLLFVPPFAEEMNRSRRVVALQAEALAAIGLGVLVLDLFGCGDSGGDFGEATWEQWLDDVSIAAAWLEQESQSAVGLWGLRLGASLAALAASRSADRFSRLLLWSPVARGQVFLTQFLRARVAMALSVPGVERETTATLRQFFARGEPVEVAGYTVNAPLAAAIDAIDLSVLTPKCRSSVHWLDIVPNSSATASDDASQVIAAWRQAGCQVSQHVETAPRFWNLVETTIAPQLVEATT